MLKFKNKNNMNSKNTIKKLSFNTNINANSNKSFTSRTITKSHRKSRPISTNSSPGRIYNNMSNVNDSKMISKLKSEISIMNNMLMNEKNKNKFLQIRNQNLRNCLMLNKNKCDLIERNFKDKFNNDTLYSEISFLFHSTFDTFLNIIENIISTSHVLQDKISAIQNEIINSIDCIVSKDISFLDSNFDREIERIKAWNEIKNTSTLSSSHKKLFYHKSRSNSIDNDNSNGNNNVSIHNNINIKTYLIKKPKINISNTKKFIHHYEINQRDKDDL